MEIPEGEGGKGREAICEAIMTENFPKLVSDTKPQSQEEAQRASGKINVKKQKQHKTNIRTIPLYLGISYLHCRKTKIKEKS